MKKFFPILCFIFLSTILIADNETNPLKSSIKNVTVFRKGAQVSREAISTIPTGISKIKFTDISPDIDKNSIQVKVEDDELLILSVLHQVNYLEPARQSDSILTLQNEQEKYSIQINEANAMIEVFGKEQAFILANQSIGSREKGVPLDQLSATADFYRSRFKEIKFEILKLNRQMVAYRKERNKITNHINALKGKKGKYTSEIVVTLDAPQKTNTKFILSYAVNNAGWFATYDLRVKDVLSPINLNYKANVYQTSGEDWNNVQLTLSTGNPSKSGTKPQLSPWYLNFHNPAYSNYQARKQRYEAGVYSDINDLGAKIVRGKITDEYGEALIGANILIKGTSIGAVTDFNGNFQLPATNLANTLIISYTGYSTLETAVTSSNMNIVLAEGGLILDEVVVTGMSKKRFKKKKDKNILASASKPVATTVKQNTTTTEFKIEKPYTILTDGKKTVVRIKDHSMKSSYQYYCAPKLDLNAFLTAQVTGWEDYYLLNGEANLFFEGTYIGKSYLDVLNTEDTLSISLGRDENIVIERTRQKDFTKRKFLSGKKRDTRGWTISVRNKKKQAIKLIIEDQTPISTNSEIEVKHEIENGGILEEETGFITWDLDLNAGVSKELKFRYEVKYPKAKHILLE